MDSIVSTPTASGSSEAAGYFNSIPLITSQDPEHAAVTTTQEVKTGNASSMPKIDPSPITSSGLVPEAMTQVDTIFSSLESTPSSPSSPSLFLLTEVSELAANIPLLVESNSGQDQGNSIRRQKERQGDNLQRAVVNCNIGQTVVKDNEFSVAQMKAVFPTSLSHSSSAFPFPSSHKPLSNHPPSLISTKPLMISGDTKTTPSLSTFAATEEKAATVIPSSSSWTTATMTTTATINTTTAVACHPVTEARSGVIALAMSTSSSPLWSPTIVSQRPNAFDAEEYNHHDNNMTEAAVTVYPFRPKSEENNHSRGIYTNKGYDRSFHPLSPSTATTSSTDHFAPFILPPIPPFSEIGLTFDKSRTDSGAGSMSQDQQRQQQQQEQELCCSHGQQDDNGGSLFTVETSLTKREHTGMNEHQQQQCESKERFDTYSSSNNNSRLDNKDIHLQHRNTINMGIEGFVFDYDPSIFDYIQSDENEAYILWNSPLPINNSGVSCDTTGPLPVVPQGTLKSSNSGNYNNDGNNGHAATSSPSSVIAGANGQQATTATTVVERPLPFSPACSSAVTASVSVVKRWSAGDIFKPKEKGRDSLENESTGIGPSIGTGIGIGTGVGASSENARASRHTPTNSNHSNSYYNADASNNNTSNGLFSTALPGLSKPLERLGGSITRSGSLRGKPSATSSNPTNNGTNNPLNPPGERIIMAATVEKLVEKLTSDIDYTFLTDFFLIYRLFISPLALLKLLLARFYWALIEDEGANAPQRQVVRVRTFVTIRHWLLNYFEYDFMGSKALRRTLVQSLKSLANHPIILTSVRDERIIRELRRLFQLKRRLYCREAAQVTLEEKQCSFPLTTTVPATAVKQEWTQSIPQQQQLQEPIPSTERNVGWEQNNEKMENNVLSGNAISNDAFGVLSSDPQEEDLNEEPVRYMVQRGPRASNNIEPTYDDEDDSGTDDTDFEGDEINQCEEENQGTFTNSENVPSRKFSIDSVKYKEPMSDSLSRQELARVSTEPISDVTSGSHYRHRSSCLHSTNSTLEQTSHHYRSHTIPQTHEATHAAQEPWPLSHSEASMEPSPSFAHSSLDLSRRPSLEPHTNLPSQPLATGITTAPLAEKKKIWSQYMSATVGQLSKVKRVFMPKPSQSAQDFDNHHQNHQHHLIPSTSTYLQLQGATDGGSVSRLRKGSRKANAGTAKHQSHSGHRRSCTEGNNNDNNNRITTLSREPLQISPSAHLSMTTINSTAANDMAKPSDGRRLHRNEAVMVSPYQNQYQESQCFQRNGWPSSNNNDNQDNNGDSDDYYTNHTCALDLRPELISRNHDQSQYQYQAQQTQRAFKNKGLDRRRSLQLEETLAQFNNRSPGHTMLDQNRRQFLASKTLRRRSSLPFDGLMTVKEALLHEATTSSYGREDWEQAEIYRYEFDDKESEYKDKKEAGEKATEERKEKAIDDDENRSLSPIFAPTLPPVSDNNQSRSLRRTSPKRDGDRASWMTYSSSSSSIFGAVLSQGHLPPSQVIHEYTGLGNVSRFMESLNKGVQNLSSGGNDAQVAPTATSTGTVISAAGTLGSPSRSGAISSNEVTSSTDLNIKSPVIKQQQQHLEGFGTNTHPGPSPEQGPNSRRNSSKSRTVALHPHRQTASITHHHLHHHYLQHQGDASLGRAHPPSRRHSAEVHTKKAWDTSLPFLSQQHQGQKQYQQQCQCQQQPLLKEKTNSISKISVTTISSSVSHQKNIEDVSNEFLQEGRSSATAPLGHPPRKLLEGAAYIAALEETQRQLKLLNSNQESQQKSNQNSRNPIQAPMVLPHPPGRPRSKARPRPLATVSNIAALQANQPTFSLSLTSLSSTSDQNRSSSDLQVLNVTSTSSDTGSEVTAPASIPVPVPALAGISGGTSMVAPIKSDPPKLSPGLSRGPSVGACRFHLPLHHMKQSDFSPNYYFHHLHHHSYSSYGNSFSQQRSPMNPRFQNIVSPTRELAGSSQPTSPPVPMILRFRSELIAQQLCLIERELLNQVPWYELVSAGWKKKKSPTEEEEEEDATISMTASDLPTIAPAPAPTATPAVTLKDQIIKKNIMDSDTSSILVEQQVGQQQTTNVSSGTTTTTATKMRRPVSPWPLSRSQTVQTARSHTQRFPTRCQTKDSPNVTRLVDRFNLMCRWVTTVILKTTDLEMRVKVVEKFIRIAQICYYHSNFSTLTQIMLALQVHEVSRLTRTWSRIGSQEMKIMHELEEFTSMLHNWKHLRSAMKEIADEWGGATTGIGSISGQDGSAGAISSSSFMSGSGKYQSLSLFSKMAGKDKDKSQNSFGKLAHNRSSSFGRISIQSISPTITAIGTNISSNTGSGNGGASIPSHPTIAASSLQGAQSLEKEQPLQCQQQQACGGCIPFLGVYLSDLLYNTELPSFVGPKATLSSEDNNPYVQRMLQAQTSIHPHLPQMLTDPSQSTPLYNSDLYCISTFGASGNDISHDSGDGDFTSSSSSSSLPWMVNMHKHRTIATIIKRVLTFRTMASRYPFVKETDIYEQLMAIEAVDQAEMERLSELCEEKVSASSSSSSSSAPNQKSVLAN
ncbi:hypothetical protein BX616_009970 [Lobosporangium transversale]|nr:hypothetical protein BX616_009970 [Lobosporangium transversale]